MRRSLRRLWPWAVIVVSWLGLNAPPACAQGVAAPPSAVAAFPAGLVDFVPSANNPIFAAEGPGHWDARIYERGWIMREGENWHLWYTASDGTPGALRQLGYATSTDGLKWSRSQENPLLRGLWVEDMMVVNQGDTYYMFAEGLHDRAQLLTSKDRVNWTREGRLDVRYTNGKPLSDGPYGTPTAWLEGGVWHLFYERLDAGVWLATSKDMKVWTNLQDKPVLVPGPEEYDKDMIALNQIVKHYGAYYAYYHGSRAAKPRVWSTNVARSTDLVQWVKYPKNPIVGNNKSSGILVFDGRQFRLYTMHEAVDVYFPRDK